MYTVNCVRTAKSEVAVSFLTLPLPLSTVEGINPPGPCVQFELVLPLLFDELLAVPDTLVDARGPGTSPIDGSPLDGDLGERGVCSPSAARLSGRSRAAAKASMCL
jgi:hypothetical protein